MDIKEWIDRNPPGRVRGNKGSEFSQYESEIRTLFEKGYSQGEIHKYLQEEKGIKAGRNALTRWMLRHQLQYRSGRKGAGRPATNKLSDISKGTKESL